MTSCDLYGTIISVKIKERNVQYFYTSLEKSPIKDWLKSIKDGATLAILYKRIRQASLGNFGDFKSVGSGVFEMRINYGPGLRIYYGVYNDEIILLLMGGSKRTQDSDIKKAKANWILWKENIHV